jgi:hypothetical protein
LRRRNQVTLNRATSRETGWFQGGRKMVRPKKKIDIPTWFNLSSYAAASYMDAADWYLNLSMRGKLSRQPNDFFLKFLQRQPIVRRGEDTPIELIISGREFGPDFTAILNGREPRLNVEHLSAEEMYVFEQWLPKDIREFGRTYEPGKSQKAEAPDGFTKPIDQLFERRLLRVFTRINLAAPDDVLVEDLLHFVARERAALAVIGGPQPYRTALRELQNKKRPNLKSWAKLGVLPYLDIELWCIGSGAAQTQESIAEQLEIEVTALPETKRYASLLLDEMVLNGWLMKFAREEMRKKKR